MEEYEVRQSYNRKDKTELIIEDILISSGTSSVQGGYIRNIQLILTFQVMNISESIENQYKMEVTIPKAYLTISALSRFHVRDKGRFSVFSIPNNSPIYQKEITSVISATVELTSATKALLLDPVTVKLYYSNGVKTRGFVLGNDQVFHGKPLNEWAWM